MSEKGMDIVGNDQDNQIFVLLTTFLRNFTKHSNVNIIYIQAVSGNAIDPLLGEIEALLRALLMSLAIAGILGYPASVSTLGLLMAFAGSVASGALAGIYPSLKATTIQPVDIIRS